MSDSSSAACREWHAIAPDGSEHVLHLSVGVPSLQPTGEWATDVSLGILDPRTRQIFGVDAWQAVQLGMRFAAQRAAHFEAEGWRFYWEFGGDPAPATELCGA